MARVRAAVFEQPDFPDYELLDSGHGEKLERYGERVVRRPDPQALWRPRLDPARWRAADLAFSRDPQSGGRRGRWFAAGVPVASSVPDADPTHRGRGKRSAAARGRPGGAGRAVAEGPRWTVGWRGARAVLRPTGFKHVGLFPEQAGNWAFAEERLARLPGSEPAVLNVFGYTGLASVVAARAGARVTHVDASRSAIAWTRENAASSGLAPDALRVVCEDALGFLRRAVRRGERYAGVLLDPPHHGKGPRGERWQFEEHAAELVELAGTLLADAGFLVLSTYAFGTSPLALEGLLEDLRAGPGDPVLEVGELALRESSGGRRLPCGFCARLARGGA